MATVLFDISVLRSVTRLRGIGRYIADLGLGLGRLGSERPEFRLLALESLPWMGEPQVGTELVASIERTLNTGRRELISHASWAYRKRLVTRRALRTWRPDLLHSGHPDATPLGSLVCKHVVTCHDLIPLKYPERYAHLKDGYGWGRRFLDTRRYTRADHIIAISRATADDLVRLLHVPVSKISVVHNGVDLARWSAETLETDSRVIERHGLKSRPYALFVGDADWRKNVGGMLAAVANVRRRPGGEELILAWAGKLCEQRQDEVRQMAEAVGAADAVELLGYVSDSDLAALYRHAVCQLFVSRAEGFGYPAIEAMACGCPVIASGQSSIGEVVGDAAVLVDPERHDQISSALYDLLRASSASRARLSEAGVKRASEFTMEKMAAGTLQVYERVVS